jgi:hypothetical protein
MSLDPYVMGWYDRGRASIAHGPWLASRCRLAELEKNYQGNTRHSAAVSAEEDTRGPAIAIIVSLGAGETGGPAEDRKNDLSQLALIYHRTPFAAPRANSLRSANMFHVARIVFFQYVLLPICNTLTSHSP